MFGLIVTFMFKSKIDESMIYKTVCISSEKNIDYMTSNELIDFINDQIDKYEADPPPRDKRVFVNITKANKAKFKRLVQFTLSDGVTNISLLLDYCKDDNQFIDGLTESEYKNIIKAHGSNIKNLSIIKIYDD